MATQTELDQARAALHQLSLGRHAVSVEKDGRKTTFNQVNKAQLQAYVAELELALGVTTRRRSGPARVC